jgi:ABC-2 type transport system permease protein
MRHWLASFRLLLLWRLNPMRTLLPIVVLIQVALAVGIVYGLPLLLPTIDATTALYLCTGSPTLILLLAGLTIVPQEVAQARRSGAYDYMRTLPVPGLAHMAAEISVWVIAQLPGTALALLVAALRFHFALHLSPLVVPVTALVAVTAAAIGYAMAVGLPVPIVTTISQFLSLGLLLFSPIDFPLSRLPSALQAVHHVLPVESMAGLMRWSMTGSGDDSVGLGVVVVTAWCIASLLICRRVATARG